MNSVKRHLRIAHKHILTMTIICLITACTKSQLESQARTEVTFIALEFITYYSRYGDCSSPCNVIIAGKEDMYLISNSETDAYGMRQLHYRGVGLCAFPEYRFGGDRLLDPWGNPYRMRFEASACSKRNCKSQVILLVWSFGRNEIDEGGAGDDIAEFRCVMNGHE
jgi:hypothetical protein